MLPKAYGVTEGLAQFNKEITMLIAIIAVTVALEASLATYGWVCNAF